MVSNGINRDQGTTATGGPWGIWVQAYYASNATNSSTTGSISTNSIVAWANWCSPTSVSITSTSGYAQAVWISWLGGAAQPMRQYNTPVAVAYNHPITREAHDAQMKQKRTAALARLKSEMAEDVRAHMRKKAVERAELLLAQHLTDEQRRDRETKGFFLVETKSGRRYRVEKNSQAGNVKLVNPEGKDIAKFCIHPSEAVPNADAHLAQKLMLLLDEETFIRTANMTYLEGIDRKTVVALDTIRKTPVRRAA
jgi:hypothetical protein